MEPELAFQPRPVPRVETKYRRIITDFPAPASIPVLEKLAENELKAMGGQPFVVWDRAEGFQVYDASGNCWLDFSSGVLITNAGHGRQEIVDAIKAQVDKHLLASYAFPTAIRADLCERFASITPEPLKKIFLLTTGSEAVEYVIKVARAHGQMVGGRKKNVIVSYEKAFHGRTLGSQQAGGIPALKDWIGNLDPGFVQLPFPDGFWTEDTSFEFFERKLAEAGVAAADVCGVIMETYQGGTAALAPPAYIQMLRKWCDAHKVVLVFDEVQAGFGRTGKMWGYEHYGVVPDLTTWGKGISSSLPIAAVAGRKDLMDISAPGTASSTHSGSPVCCAAALANLDIILNEKLPENAAAVGEVLHTQLKALMAKHPDVIGCVHGKGLVAGLACVRPGTKQPDGPLAKDVVRRSVEKGLLMFNPVGPEGCTIKINPPLVITAEAVREGCAVLAEAMEEALAARGGKS
ncbi:MAG TPA: aspartate aminotransferase family protein [Bryobacteraceae bacterium]|nr:aspartate aminotransferase family protein [Bryobacteraceae bacterium]HPT25124.1 aspartate aminotransferase family protein [Bryobacteraceae bacterium]